MKFDIWVEGYCATGGSSTAQLMASNVEGKTFRDAVLNWYNSNPEEIEKGWGSFNEKKLSFWGCRVFPTEEEARKSFG